MKNKTVLLVINDEYCNSEEAKLTERSILKHLGGSHRIMKMSFTFFTEKGFYAVPFNTTLVVFIIKKSERKICDTLLYKYIPMSARVDFYYINEEEKKEENETMTINEERVVSAKETIDVLIKSHNRLIGIEDFCNNDKIVNEYIRKAIKNTESLGGIQSIDYYVEAIKMMSNDINNLNNLLTNYLEEINNNKKDLEEYNKMKPLINQLKSVFKEN